MNNPLLRKHVEEFAQKIRDEAKEVLSDFESDILPYIDEDTIFNAQFQAVDIVESILAGDFEWDGDYIIVSKAREFSPRVRIAFDKMKYDRLRDNIIAHMPKCPKDDKIAALEEELERAYRRW
jgi:hypothetical protein